MRTEFIATFGKKEKKFYQKIVDDINSLGVNQSDLIKFALLNLRNDFVDDPNEKLNQRDIKNCLKGVKFQWTFSSDENEFLVSLKAKIENNIQESLERSKNKNKKEDLG